MQSGRKKARAISHRVEEMESSSKLGPLKSILKKPKDDQEKSKENLPMLTEIEESLEIEASNSKEGNSSSVRNTMDYSLALACQAGLKNSRVRYPSISFNDSLNTLLDPEDNTRWQTVTQRNKLKQN